MKILHMIFDGYTPLLGNLVSLEGWYGFRKRSMLPEMETYINIFKIKDMDYIWNRLSEQNITSFNIIPHLFSDAFGQINHSSDKAQVISPVLGQAIAQYHGMDKKIEICSWEDFSSCCKVVPAKEEDKIPDKLKTLPYAMTEENYNSLNEKIVKNVGTYARLLQEYKGEQYVSIVIPESSSMYVFGYPYEEICTRYVQYFQMVLDMFLNKIKPDLVFVHGTHEMKLIENSTELSNVQDIFYKGRSSKAIYLDYWKSFIYMEPDNHASLMVYTRDADMYKLLDRYFAEFCYIKGTVHEKMYRFLTEKFKELLKK